MGYRTMNRPGPAHGFKIQPGPARPMGHMSKLQFFSKIKNGQKVSTTL
jgi:hypothetical protein